MPISNEYLFGRLFVLELAMQLLPEALKPTSAEILPLDMNTPQEQLFARLNVLQAGLGIVMAGFMMRENFEAAHGLKVKFIEIMENPKFPEGFGFTDAQEREIKQHMQQYAEFFMGIVIALENDARDRFDDMDRSHQRGQRN